MPEYIAGRLRTDGAPGQVVMVEIIDDPTDDIEYAVRVADVPEPVRGWSIAWLFVGIAFFIGLGLGSWIF